LLDPDVNVQTGTSILASNLAANNNKLFPALAAYYGGPAAAKNLKSEAAQTYLSKFVKQWLRLWGTTPPLETKISRNTVVHARWWSEEATRKLESALELIREARRGLVEEVTPNLYDIESAVD
jgi:soluble lytic murein transglycosylase-like protein